MDEELSNLSYISDSGIWSQNGILIIQVIVSSDLKCVREEVNIAKP